MQYSEKIELAAAPFDDRVKKAIKSAIRPSVDAAMAMDNALAAAQEADALIESTHESELIMRGIGAAVARSHAEFTNTLAALTRMGMILNGKLTTVPIAAAEQGAEHIQQHDAEHIQQQAEIPRPQHYKFGLRDIVHVELEVPVIGKIIDRGPLIAVCELTSGAWVQPRHATDISNHMIMKKGKTFLMYSHIYIIPYDVCYSKAFGYFDLKTEDIVGVNEYYKSNGKAPLTGKLMSLKDIWLINLSNGTSQIHYHEFVNPASLKYRVLRHEQSYRVLVAGEDEFKLDEMRTRATKGEHINLRNEIEWALHGVTAPNVIAGIGVEFQYVLESQITPFTL